MKNMMKKFFVMTLVFAMVFGVKLNIKAATPNYTETFYKGIYYGRVTAADGLYVYSEPNSTKRRLDGGVSHNWLVRCLAYTSNGFTKIQYYYGQKNNTFTGYVHTQYLEITKVKKPIEDDEEKFTNIYGYTGVVTASRLNVHSSLDFDGNDRNIFTTIKYDDRVQVLAKSKSWYKIKFVYKKKNTIGYVSRSYVKVEDSMKSLKVKIPTKTFDSSKKYKLTVTDPTLPFALSKKITWSSSKKSVATVSSNGYVTAKGPGTAKITAKVKCGDRTKKITVKVNVKEYFTLQ